MTSFACSLPCSHALFTALACALCCALMAALGEGAAWAKNSDFSTGVIDARESPRSFEFELSGTFFTPRLDDESGLTDGPYAKIFDNKRLWLFEAEFDFELIDLLGPLGVGISAGWGRVSGKGIYADSGEPSLDSTSLILLPTRLMAVYRFQYFDRKGVPLIPFVKAGLSYTFWWTKGTSGAVSNVNGHKGRGGKWGYNLAIGLALSLNFIDRPLARDADRLWGINDTHLIVQFIHTTADNFGGDGFDLSRDSLNVGLGIEF